LRSKASSSNHICRLGRTLQVLGIRFRSGGPDALEDKPSKPDWVWNRIPDDIRQRIVMMAFISLS
jgi:hypothetical protein